MWQLTLRVQSRNQTDTRALAACLATDCETPWNDDASFSIHLEETTVRTSTLLKVTVRVADHLAPHTM